MDTKAILDQLLSRSQQATQRGRDIAEDKLGVPESGPERDAMLNGMGKGALAAGAVALLLGTSSGRKLTGTALKVGGLAAVGGLAYKAYNDWQAKQAGTPVADTGTPIDQLAEPAANERSTLLVRAMIAAAKADGHIDEQERSRIETQIRQLGLEQDITSFLLDELNRPLDVRALADLSDSVESAAEIYLASAMVIDVDTSQERQYLDSLASALNLDPDLAAELEMRLS